MFSFTNHIVMNVFSKFLMGTAAVLLVPAVSVSCRQKEEKVAIVAHRGYWNCEKAGYAKNSLAALKCAQEAGCA